MLLHSGVAVAVVCLLVGVAPRTVSACTPTEELSLAEKIAEADVLLLGEVLRLYKETRIPGNAYTAEMKIYCVLKAPINIPVSAVHNISEAGVIDGRCYSVNLEVNKRYIILGYTFGDEIRPYDDGIEATVENIQKVSQVCGMSPRLPLGIAASDSMKCPMHVDENGCLINSGNVPPKSGADTGYEHRDQGPNEPDFVPADTGYTDHGRQEDNHPGDDADYEDNTADGEEDDENDAKNDANDVSEYEMAASHNTSPVIGHSVSIVLFITLNYFL